MWTTKDINYPDWSFLLPTLFNSRLLNWRTMVRRNEVFPKLNSRTEPTRSSDVADKVADRLGQEEPECPEYIPRKKAKNPMMKLGYAWMIGLPAGIIGFILAKRQVDKNRLKQLKVRQRMKRSNEGEYDGSRYPSTGKQNA
uniref:Uncharacterized protein n=1 Tax=Xiphophorus couchianus TaxID=32473 RepID=A0A3B5LDJ2_9TELE